MDERRTLRISETVREELSEIIGFETSDPRLLAVFNTTVRKELPLPGAPEPKADEKGKKPSGPGIMALVDSGPAPRPTRPR